MEAFVLSTVLLFGDWMQTREIVQGPQYETNLFLGKDPSLTRVNAWFAGAMVVNGVIGYSLPKEYRRPWFYTVSVVESGFIFNNYQIGVRVNF